MKYIVYDFEESSRIDEYLAGDSTLADAGNVEEFTEKEFKITQNQWTEDDKAYLVVFEISSVKRFTFPPSAMKIWVEIE